MPGDRICADGKQPRSGNQLFNAFEMQMNNQESTPEIMAFLFEINTQEPMIFSPDLKSFPNISIQSDFHLLAIRRHKKGDAQPRGCARTTGIDDARPAVTTGGS
ncbi:hypothetical protein [Bordetella petrii]|uniref:hypothetical protein n=1 Tax=Bordetella petrii TaxID=94624 RepID=UPI0038B2869F